jgi:putative DNA primase/helicase
MTPGWIAKLQTNARGHLPAFPDLTVQTFNDYGNGLRFLAVYGDDVRYCPEFKTELVFDGMRWLIDRAQAARSLAQDVMVQSREQLLATANGDKASIKWANRCPSSYSITNALREAMPHLAIGVERLDQDPHLLNFENGTVDLRTGILRPHRRDDLITKLVPHAFNPDAKCPLLFAFLERMLPGLTPHIQRRVGYSFTGLVHEKIIIICYGPKGNNGKTCLTHTIYRVLGTDYAAMLPIGALTEERSDNNTMAALADLRGARFFRVTEADEGQRLSEAQLKRICQGMDAPIQGARKFEHVITFPETFKVWLDANHLPAIRGTDNAIWSRLQVIPFDVTLTDDEIDRELPAKLAEEAEGILAWGVAGAVRWFKEGLDKPDKFRAAGDEWRQDSDQIGRFIRDCCVEGSFASAKAGPLYQAYRKWADEGGEKRVASNNDFAHSIVNHGFAKRRSNAGVVYEGIGLCTLEPAP